MAFFSIVKIQKFASVVEGVLDMLNIGNGQGFDAASYKVSSVILSLGIILIVGFLMTRLTKLLKLPNVTAYIFAGLLIGPNLLNVIPERFLSESEFLNDIAMAFIAFSAGEFFKIKNLRENGFKPILISICVTVFGFLSVFSVTKFLLGVKTTFALILGAISCTISPASTIMTIRQTNSKGDFVNTLLEVNALCNLITLILFSITLSICVSIEGGNQVTFGSVGLPILQSLICLILGFVFGFLLKILLPKKRSTDNRLIIVISILFLFAGICSLLNQSPLLGCMAMGMAYTNIADPEDKLFKQINYFSPPIILLFFMRSGMNFKIGSFVNGSMIGSVPLIVVSLVYVVSRAAGLFIGSYSGSVLTNSKPNIRKYLGLGLFSYGSVAIGLAAMGARTFVDAGQIELANCLNTIVLTASIIYEFVGPASTKLGLYLSKSYSNNLDEIVPVEERKDKTESLIEQIQRISKEIPKLPEDDNEIAFDEAALEYDLNNFSRNYRRFINRK